jgi:copper chaperone
MATISLLVNDMSCGHCEATIREAVRGADAASRCEVDLASKRVAVESALPAERFLEAIAKAGYHPLAEPR